MQGLEGQPILLKITHNGKPINTSEVSSLKFKNGITKTYVDLTPSDTQSDAQTATPPRLRYFQSITMRAIIKLLNKIKTLTTAMSS